jgi:hypothetical protein
MREVPAALDTKDTTDTKVKPRTTLFCTGTFPASTAHPRGFRTSISFVSFELFVSFVSFVSTRSGA